MPDAMKKVAMLMMGLTMMFHSVSGKVHSYDYANYGFNISQSQSGSGFGRSTNFNFNIQLNNRLFEVGYLMDANTQKYMGLEFQYKHFLGFYRNEKNGGQFNKMLKPFFYYNFLYHAPTEMEGNITLSQSSVKVPATGTMTSFEHAIGLGFQVKLLGGLYMENSLGFGAYLGSKYQGDEKPGTIGIHKTNFGFAPSFHLGFGYQF
jgi:hypothetical protein